MITLITGMSGTGKSTTIAELAKRGYRAIDLDNDGWSHWVPCEGNPTGANPGHDWLWNEEKLAHLLSHAGDSPLFVAGCAPNMGLIRSRFDQVFLLVAPLNVILERVALRKNNSYGQHLKRQTGLRQISTRLCHCCDAPAPMNWTPVNLSIVS